MEQDMNSYLEQLRARAEKRLQDEQGQPTPPTSTATETVSAAKHSDVDVDDLLSSITKTQKEDTKTIDTLTYDNPSVSYNKESEKMMGDLMEWADRDATLPFDSVSEESENTASQDSVEPDTQEEEVPAQNIHKAPVEESKPIYPEKEEKTVSKKEFKLSEREQKKKAKEYRKALVDKENGNSRGIIGEIFYVILFIILVLLTILAVLYLLQTIAGIKILDVESLFDMIFGWISSKI